MGNIQSLYTLIYRFIYWT